MPTQNFKVGEMLNKRTPNSKTWMNFDGSYTTEIHSGIVHYEDVNGNLQNIDTDLQDEADFDQIDFPVAKDGDSLFFAAKEKAMSDKKKNKLNRDNFDFQGLKVPFEAKLPRNIKRGYSIGKGASKLKFIPVNASPSKGYVEGNKITYQDVWNDADLILEVMPDGIKETIILKSERAPITFSFEVQGELNSELKIQPPWLQDATGTKRDVVQGVEDVDGKTIVSLAADVSGLVYPIEIDPTVSIQPDESTLKDAYVYSGNGGTNYGGVSTVLVGKSGSGLEYQTFIQFDLSTIPTGSIISSGLVSLQATGWDGNANYQFVSAVTSLWDENTITYGNRPTLDAAKYDRKLVSNTGRKEWNITSLLQNWVSNVLPNNGMAILTDSTTLNTTFIYSSSTDVTGSNRPKLTVTYNAPPTAPTVTTPNGGETWNSLHTVVWQAATDSAELVMWEPATATNNSTYSNVEGVKWGQTYTADRDGYISEAELLVSHDTAKNITVYISDVGADGMPGSTIYGQGVMAVGTAAAYCKVKFDNPVKVTSGQTFAIYSLNKVTHYWISSNAYSGGARFAAGALSSGDLKSKIYYDTATQLQEMQHQIQLSTDNGTTWKDIVSLTSAGATSYSYDFINEAESSTAKIRIRAYDGSAYGSWDESNGVFTIQHNQAPTAPTNLSPSSGTRDRASVNRLSWQHNDANADPQAKFDLQWRVQGASSWNDVTQSTVNQYYDAPANLFPRGTIEWRVRTYDQAGLSSPYSAIATFFAGDKPSVPTITAPSALVAVANPTVQWSSVGQTGYKLTVKDTSGNTVFNVERNSTNKAETITYNLANQTDYDIELSIKNADGLYSDPATLRINVSYTPPAIPDIETVKGNGFIQINILDPAPEGTQPAVTSHNVYKEIDGEFVLIATGIANEFKDYQVASNEMTRYFVRTFGDNGTFSDTITFSESISFMGVWLHIVDEPSTLYQFKFDGEGRGTSWNLENAVHRFAGRRNPVMEIGVMEDYAVIFSLMILDEPERVALERIVYSGETVCYRDGRGRKAFGVFVDVPLNDEKALTYSTSLTLMKIDFKEAFQ